MVLSAGLGNWATNLNLSDFAIAAHIPMPSYRAMIGKVIAARDFEIEISCAALVLIPINCLNLGIISRHNIRLREFAMRLNLIILALLSIAGTTQAAAQTAAPVPAEKTFASSIDVTNLIAKAKADKKEGQAIVIEPILALAPYKANLEYRTLVGPAAIHEKEAEVFYVIDGKGTMVIGGKLVGEFRQNAENLSGTGIEGGLSTALAKGDFLVVPQNTAHWVNSVDGTLVLMSLHVPRQ